MSMAEPNTNVLELRWSTLGSPSTDDGRYCWLQGVHLVQDHLLFSWLAQYWMSVDEPFPAPSVPVPVLLPITLRTLAELCGVPQRFNDSSLWAFEVDEYVVWATLGTFTEKGGLGVSALLGSARVVRALGADDNELGRARALVQYLEHEALNVRERVRRSGLSPYPGAGNGDLLSKEI